MRLTRVVVAATAVAAIAGLGGCGTGPDASSGASSAATAPSTPADPSAELSAAAEKLAETTAKLTLTAAGTSAAGVFDPGGQRVELTMTVGSGGQLVIRQIGDDLFVRTDESMARALGATPGKWLHTDLSQVPETSPLNPKNNDPRNTARLLAASTEVTRSGDHAFTGTLDLTKSPTGNPAALKAMGDKAKAVPFSATTDADGRLTSITIDMESVVPGAGQVKTEYSDFGVPVSLEAPPASQVAEMPARFRQALGG